MWWDWLIYKYQSWLQYESEYRGGGHTGGGGGFSIWSKLLLLALVIDVGHWERIGGWLRIWIEEAFGGGGGGGF